MHMHIHKHENNIAISIYSKKAQEILKDRRKKGISKTHKIFGFKTFCTLSRLVLEQARNDDPYADLILFEMERRIDKASATINSAREKLHENFQLNEFDELARIIINTYPPLALLNQTQFLSAPISIRPNSHIIYINIGAALIGIFDQLICTALTYRKLKIIDSQTYHKYIYSCHSAILGVFSAPCILNFILIMKK